MAERADIISGAQERAESTARVPSAQEKAALTPRDLALRHWPSIAPRPYAEHDGAPLPDESAQRGHETRGPDAAGLTSPNGPGADAYDVGAR